MASKPNFILILADDMGYSDLGCYGSEINTPNIDSLASSGIRFSQMYNSARCCPSRAALLTGLNPQQTGVGHMVSTFGQASSIRVPAYQGYLNETSVTIAEVLKENGYQTYMSGKWHVVQRGFDKFFGIVAGAANFFHPRTLMKDENFLDIDTSDFYLTDAISENAVSMLEDSSKTDKPFFMHVAYTAPHWPLQAYEEDIAKYVGKYRQGWDKIRTSRHEELKGMGILDSKWEISPRDSSSKPWGAMEERDWEDLRMAVYAAMIDRMDQGIGKILDKLKELSLDENTVVMFLSDNGGCAEFLAEETERPTPLQYSTPTPDGRKIQIGNKKGLNPGPDDTFMSYDLPWANASNTPFRLFKRWTHEGGISTPFILSWPKRINKPSIVHEPTHIIDIAATIYDAAQAVYPKEYNGNPITALEGSSFLEVLNEGNWKRTDPIYWEHEGSRAMRDGEWKLVSEVGEGWELYNMSEDRTELNNLAENEKDRLLKMQNSYKEWMNRCGVEDWPIPSQTWNPIMHAPHTHSSPTPR